MQLLMIFNAILEVAEILYCVYYVSIVPVCTYICTAVSDFCDDIVQIQDA